MSAEKQVQQVRQVQQQPKPKSKADSGDDADTFLNSLNDAFNMLLDDTLKGEAVSSTEILSEAGEIDLDQVVAGLGSPIPESKSSLQEPSRFTPASILPTQQSHSTVKTSAQLEVERRNAILQRISSSSPNASVVQALKQKEGLE